MRAYAYTWIKNGGIPVPRRNVVDSFSPQAVAGIPGLAFRQSEELMTDALSKREATGPRRGGSPPAHDANAAIRKFHFRRAKTGG